MKTARLFAFVPVFLVSLAFLPSLQAAQPSTREVQQALKKRGFYLGEVNGVLDEQTLGALKRFQIREGLSVTGQVDAPTAAALQKQASTSVDPALHKLPARERAQKVVQSDREFLEVVEAVEEKPGTAAQPVATPSSPPPLAATPSVATKPSAIYTEAPTGPPGVAEKKVVTESLPPVAESPAEVTRSRGSPSAASSTSSKQAARGAGNASKEKEHVAEIREQLATLAERTATEPTAVREEIAPPPPVDRFATRAESREAVSPERSAAISEEEVREFVEDYLKAAEGPRPAGEVAFFSEKVDYFDSGKVSRQFIEKDQRNYYRRWPKRDFELVTAPEVERISGGDATVRFRMRYSLGGGKERASGMTENVIRVRKAGADMRIVGIRERKVRE